MLVLCSCSKANPNTNEQQIPNLSENISTLDSNKGENNLQTSEKESTLMQNAIDDGFLIAMDENSQDFMVMGYAGNETEITIPNVATVIGSKAFVNNNTITVINIPNHVEKIMFGAFNECTALTEIYIPSSVYSIVNPFMYCDGVTIFVQENSYADEWVKNYNSSLEELNLTVNSLQIEYF